MQEGRTPYEELGVAEIAPGNQAVLSRHVSGGYTMARRVVAFGGGSEPHVTYMKGALHFKTLEGIVSLHEMLGSVIESEYGAQNMQKHL